MVHAAQVGVCLSARALDQVVTVRHAFELRAYKAELHERKNVVPARGQERLCEKRVERGVARKLECADESARHFFARVLEVAAIAEPLDAERDLSKSVRYTAQSTTHPFYGTWGACLLRAKARVCGSALLRALHLA